MSTQEWRRWNCDEAPWRRCHWFSRCGPVRYASTRGPELAAERPRAPPVCPKEAQGARNQYLPIAALEIWNLKVPKSFGIRTVFEMLVARFHFGIFACDDCRTDGSSSLLKQRRQQECMSICSGDCSFGRARRCVKGYRFKPATTSGRSDCAVLRWRC